ncbi:MAG: REP-associated tyrosine transposase [Rhodanobacteraceae bacterium]
MDVPTAKPGYRALRKGRRSLPGHIYLVTTVVRGRYPVFHNWQAACCVCRLLGAPGTWYPHACLAWVLMPDHFHALIRLGPAGSLSAAVRKAKSESARRVGKQTGLTGGLWARGFHDRAVRDPRQARKAARYIIANPLRAGLVNDVLRYSYWDAVWMGDGAGLADIW